MISGQYISTKKADFLKGQHFSLENNEVWVKKAREMQIRRWRKLKMAQRGGNRFKF